MFWTNQKNNQHYLAKTWQQALKQREIEKNNYRVTGDLKKAKSFVSLVSNFTFPETDNHASEHVIFSAYAFTVPLRLAYIFTNVSG